MEEERRWGTVAEAADEWQLCTKTVRRYISSGDIYAERLGPRLIRVDLNSIHGRPLSFQDIA
ncbi:hypothetical protein GCM10009816_22080 [Microbacterium aquimaris]